MLDLRFCARAFTSCSERGPLFIAMCGPLTIAASRVAEHRLQTRRLGNCGSRAYLLRGMWDLPRPGLKPMFPALTGRLSTTVPPGKPLSLFSWWAWLKVYQFWASFLKNSSLFYSSFILFLESILFIFSLIIIMSSFCWHWALFFLLLIIHLDGTLGCLRFSCFLRYACITINCPLRTAFAGS